MGVFDEIKKRLKNYFSNNNTTTQKSTKWKEYHLGITVTHCATCFKRNNKIYSITETPPLPEHQKCACFLTWLRMLKIGEATKFGVNGADYYLNKYGILPAYYITKQQAYNMGWIPKNGDLSKVAPGRMIGGDEFFNRENKLPSAPGRIWYECDIDYENDYRDGNRLIYSNDGLIFKTDDHYKRFISIE